MWLRATSSSPGCPLKHRREGHRAGKGAGGGAGSYDRHTHNLFWEKLSAVQPRRQLVFLLYMPLIYGLLRETTGRGHKNLVPSCKSPIPSRRSKGKSGVPNNTVPFASTPVLEKANVINEMARLLKPGGKVIIVDANQPEFDGAGVCTMDGLPSWGDITPAYRAYLKSDLEYNLIKVSRAERRNIAETFRLEL